MKKVAYYSLSPNDPTAFYRTSGVLPYVNGDIELTDISDKQIDWHVFTGVDTFIFQRPYLESHVNTIKLAQSVGVKVILDYDDNLLNVPLHNASYPYFVNAKETIKECLHLADEVWVSTEALKERYATLNANIHVIPNAHNNFILPVEKRKPFNIETKHIAYRGSSSVEVDLYKHIDDIITLINLNKDWKFNFIGSRFPYLESRSNGNHYMSNPMDLFTYFDTLGKYNPNIMFYPLEDTVFNQCKSNISFIEGTYNGAAFIGNGKLEEFAKLPIFDLQYGFKECFEVAMNNWEMCENQHKQQWEYIEENLLLSKVNKLRTERLLCQNQ